MTAVRIRGSTQVRVRVKSTPRHCTQTQKLICWFTDLCVSRRCRAALACCAASRRRRLAPLRAFVADAFAPDGAARTACTPWDRLRAHPRRAVLGAPGRTAGQAAPDQPVPMSRHPVAASMTRFSASPIPLACPHSRRQAAQLGARRTAVNPRPAPASPVLGV